MENKNISERHGKNIKIAIVFALVAALLYGLSAPFSKLILKKIEPTYLASMLYLGAGLGMLILYIAGNNKTDKEAAIALSDFPYALMMIILDIAAPILLLKGLTLTSAGSVSLINNFEIVATSIIALLIFKEAIGKRMWIAISLITLSTIILSFGDLKSFEINTGSLFVLGACFCWGLENNSTRKLSAKDPIQIVIIKGIFSGIGALIVSYISGDLSKMTFNREIILYSFLGLVLGFFAYGLSIYTYIRAQRVLGATRTSAYYAAAPFIGVVISFIVFREIPGLNFIAAVIVMIIGSYFALTEDHTHMHKHEEVTHEHAHRHDDGHHNHVHNYKVKGAHSHVHNHERLEHDHVHTPDLHHNHSH